jgi:hypothetical protein
METKEFAPDVISWLAWLSVGEEDTRDRGLENVLRLSRLQSKSSILEANLTAMLGVLLDNAITGLEVRGLTFSGKALAGELSRHRSYRETKFVQCGFKQADSSNIRFERCVFHGCDFDGVLFNAGTSINGCVFNDCTMRAVEVDKQRTLFDPREIEALIASKGGEVQNSRDEQARRAFVSRVDASAVEALCRIVRQSEKSCDVSVQDVENHFPRARGLIKEGIKSGVLKERTKQTSGANKEFVRFQVDRTVLLYGQEELTGDIRIDDF